MSWIIIEKKCVYLPDETVNIYNVCSLFLLSNDMLQLKKIRPFQLL